MSSDTKGKAIDVLTEDKPISGQEWICMSFMSPKGIKGCKIHSFKFRGAFATQEAANEYAEKIRNEDPDFDIFVGEGFKWCGWNPDPHTIPDQQYMEDQMQKLHNGYMENKKNVKESEDKRRQEMREKGIEDERAVRQNNELDRRQQTRDRLRKKLEQKQAKEYGGIDDKEQKTIADNRLKLAEKLASEERQVLEKNEQQLEEGSKQVDAIDNDLDEIQREYNALIAKRKQLEKDEKQADSEPALKVDC